MPIYQPDRNRVTMNDRVRVPITVKRSDGGSNRLVEDEPRRPVTESEPAVVEEGPVATSSEPRVAPRPRTPNHASPQEEQDTTEKLREDREMWRDRALRLQAEIENFRKRQRRLAEEHIETNRGRLLRNFLTIADDLERVLSADGDESEALREGVRVTRRSLNQLLKQEGVEPIEAEGEKFDPTWHEAVGTVPKEQVSAERDTVVEVTQQGYRLNGRLLRPARVIVAQ